MSSNPVVISRDLRLDFFRGLALWLIFLAHIPDNIISRFVPLHYGFSDAAELFIFVSGYANAYVYGRVIHQAGFLVCSAQMFNRAFHLYVAQIFLFVVFIGEIAWLSHGTDVFDDAMNVRIFHEHPDAATLAVLQLRFMPVNMDVLPVYVVLVLAFPPMLWLLSRVPMAALTLSAVLYGLANFRQINLPSYPSGFWYFNPFAWQFLFIIGAWCGLGAADWLWSLIRSRLVISLAGMYAVIALVLVATWHIRPSLGVPDWFIDCLSKTNLGILRLLHFIALAIIVDRLITQDWSALRSPLLRPFINCGQHSLEVFILGVILAFAGYVTLVGSPSGAIAHISVAALGIAAMIGLAELATWYQGTSVIFRKVRSQMMTSAIAGQEKVAVH